MQNSIKKIILSFTMLLLFCNFSTASVYIEPHVNMDTLINIQQVDAFTLQVPLFMQCGEVYSSQMLGNCSGSTICSEGCALCSMCSILSANGVTINGVPITPGTLNTYLKTSNGYSNGCLLDWSRACGIPNSTVTFEGVKNYSLATINAKLNSRSPVICYVKIPQDHFIIVVGRDGDTNLAGSYIVQDPLYSSQRRLNQYSVQNLRVFSDNVIRYQGVTGFKINNYELTSSFIVWKSPPYIVKFHWEGYSPGYIYKIVLVKGGIEVATLINNLSTSDTSFSFNASNLTVGSNYQFWVSPMGPTNPVIQSPQFTIQKLPPMNVEFLNGGLVSPGQNVSVRVTFPEGLLNATGNLTAQAYVNGVADTNIGTFPITQSEFPFTVRSSWRGKTVKIAVSNSIPPSNIPIGYLFSYSPSFFVSTTGINIEEEGIPKEYKLNQNYPNPFNPTTKIHFAVPKTNNELVKLSLFDLSGREIKTLINESMQPGSYAIELNMNEFSSGVYFYRLTTNIFTDTKKLILLK